MKAGGSLAGKLSSISSSIFRLRARRAFLPAALAFRAAIEPSSLRLSTLAASAQIRRALPVPHTRMELAAIAKEVATVGGSSSLGRSRGGDAVHLQCHRGLCEQPAR